MAELSVRRVRSPTEWMYWLPKQFDITPYRAAGLDVKNSAWLSCFAADHATEHEVFYELMRFAFDVMPAVDQTLYLLPKSEAPFQPVQEHFMPISPTEEAQGSSLMMCGRDDILPRCKVRRARVEDHDDLVPIFEAQSELLSEQYGEFFLADVIASSAEPETPQEALVAEIHGRAVGLLVVSSDVDVSLLQDCFHLAPYGGLVKPVEPAEGEEPPAAAEPAEAPSTPPPVAADPEAADAEDGAEGEAEAPTVLPGDAERAMWKDIFESMELDEDGRAPVAEVFAVASEHDEEAAAKFADVANEDGLCLSHEEFDAKLLLALWRAEFDQLEQNDNEQVSFAALLEACAAVSTENFAAIADIAQTEADVDLALSWDEFVSANEVRVAQIADAASAEVAAEAEPAEEPAVEVTSNCFGVIMYCMDERYASRARDFIEPAMSLFPDCDYCVLTQPYLSPEPSLLDAYVQVMPQSCSTFRDVLYVMHRSVTGKLETRKWKDDDAEAVGAMLEGLSNADRCMEALVACGDNSEKTRKKSKRQGYVFEFMGTVVGAAVVKDGADVALLANNFELEDHVALACHPHDGHGVLDEFVLAPIFGGFVREALHELMRQGGHTVIYSEESTAAGAALDYSMRKCMVQLKPRPPILLPPADWKPEEGSWVDKEQQQAPDYALHVFSTRLITERKETRNTRVVVVGASDTSKGFLEEMLLLPDVIFPHITMVVHGTAADGSGGVGGNLALSHCFAGDELARLALNGKVNTLHGRMQDIDRDQRMVVLDGDSLLGYDYLILATGLQESAVTSLSGAQSSLAGVWSLSNDVNIAAMEEAAPTASKVLIYGDTLQTYGAIDRVISAGAAPAAVALVLPQRPDGATSCFGNQELELVVHQHLASQGITIYQGYTLTGVEGNAEGSLVSAVFDADGKATNITCDGLACYAAPNTDLSVARALNENAVVYDGRLVINAIFQSNDPAIMAAGSVTKFSRRYGTKQPPVSYFNSREVGAALGRTVLDIAMFDGAHLDADTVPQFTKPKSKGCLLPGGLHYFCTTAPGLQAMGEGRDLVTDTPGADGSPRYTCVHVDKFDAVSSISYLGSEQLEWPNLQKLVGLPQGYCNRLVLHFDEGLIADLPSWFRQPWSMALYHDRFAELVTALKAELASRDDVKSLIEELTAWADSKDKTELDSSELAKKRDGLVSKLDTSSRRLAMDWTTEFVRNNGSTLWMILEAES
eukprot:COSAG02_NODE_257_length_26838_cov_118.324844_7_plen_1221_part_00